MNKTDPSVKWITRIKIIREPSKDKLQTEANTYIYNIESLGAKLVVTPKLYIEPVDVKAILNLQASQLIFKAHQQHPDQKVNSLEVQQKLDQYQNSMPPYVFYIQITYKVEEQIFQNNKDKF